MPLLEIKNLQTIFPQKKGLLKAVDGLNLHVDKGETVALVGESGSGKSVTALSVLRLVPEPGRILAGEIIFQEKDLLRLTERQMQKVRGKEIGLVLQDPLSALNPVMRSGEQLTEVFQYHFRFSRVEAKAEAIKMLHMVQLDNAVEIYAKYPHELSGGQRQRILIAIALACRPQLLIADEPTTALDVTIQHQILELLDSLKKQLNLSLLLITHDLGIVAEIADVVAVMYAGKIVEIGATNDLFSTPLHPYTQLLLSVMPKVYFEPNDKIHKFEIKPVQNVLHTNVACDFAKRCPFVQDECTIAVPDKMTENGRFVKCIR